MEAENISLKVKKKTMVWVKTADVLFSMFGIGTLA